MDRSTPPFPVPHKKLALDVRGNKTDLVICSYDDHFLVMVTQIGSMGTILHARKEEGVSINPTFSVSVIFGKRDEPMLVACARQLIEHISSCGSSRPLVLSLGLKDHSLALPMPRSSTLPATGQLELSMANWNLETLKVIVSMVIDNRLW